jgi:hypothetical protein
MSSPLSIPGMRPDTRSQFKKAIDANPKGTVINVCPFGCGDSDLDDHGYCKHLVGFTNAQLPEGDVKKVTDEGVVEVLEEQPNRAIATKAVGRKRLPLKPGDKLVRITQSSRVYRQDWGDEKPAEKPAEQTKKPAPAG